VVRLSAGGAGVDLAVRQDDHGDGLASATAWTIEATPASAAISGSLGVGADRDYFRVVAPSSGLWSFRSSRSPADGDVYGHLYDAAGNQLAEDDDDGNNLNFRIDYQLAAGEAYYVAIRNYSSTYGSPVGYTITATVPAPVLSLDPASVAFETAGGSAPIVVTTNLASWSVASHPGWLAVDSGGSAGGGQFRVTAPANPGAERSGTVVVAGGGLEARLAVTQEAAVPAD
jgi:hypothetical protein